MPIDLERLQAYQKILDKRSYMRKARSVTSGSHEQSHLNWCRRALAALQILGSVTTNLAHIMAIAAKLFLEYFFSLNWICSIRSSDKTGHLSGIVRIHLDWLIG